MKGRWIILLLVVIVVIVQFVRPVPNLDAQTTISQTITVPGKAPVIHWPSQGESALAIQGVGTIGQNGTDTPVPIASVTKIMTAYLTLKKHPLGANEDGPSVAVTADDVATYNQDNSLGESVAPVVAGEQLTEKQALEALMLPSANNVATLLAKWNSGSEAAFVAEMNATAKQLGMTHTHYEDASGYNPASVSTASDQIKMAEAAMQDQTFRQVVAMPQATIPTAGTIYNVDYVLGKNGIIGIKTGSTDQAGGCFVFAATDSVNGNPYTIVGAVLGQTGDQELMTALDDSLQLVTDAKSALTTVPVLTKQQTVANVVAAWSKSQPDAVVPQQAVSLVGWPGMTIQTKVNVSLKDKQLTANEQIGNIQLVAGDQKATVPLQSTNAIQAPSYLWRLTHL